MSALKRKVLDALIASPVQEAADKTVTELPATDIRLIRRHKRMPINVRAIVQMGIASKATVISDISKGGLGLSPADGLYPGCDVTIVLITGETKTGIVRWWLAGSCGVQFNLPVDDNDAFQKAVKRKSGAIFA